MAISAVCSRNCDIFKDYVDDMEPIIRVNRRHMKRKSTSFEERVYAVVRRIPKGRTRSYGWVARQLGLPGAAQAVGQALKRNPDTQHTPCHRVIRADGLVGGYTAYGGSAKKQAKLRREGAIVY